MNQLENRIMNNLDDQSVTLTHEEKIKWAAYVFGKDSIHATIPERKLVIHCVKCKEPTSNLIEHLKTCKLKHS